jgi:hypothetical protein
MQAYLVELAELDLQINQEILVKPEPLDKQVQQVQQVPLEIPVIHLLD